MTLMQSFSLFQMLTAAVLLLASVTLTFGLRKDAPDSLRRDMKTTSGLIFFFFAGYIFFVFIMVGNISYPIEPVTASMLLGSACFVYADIILIRAFVRRAREKDIEIEQYTQQLKNRTASLENEVAERKKAEDALRLLEKAACTTNTGITVRSFEGEVLYTNRADAGMHGYTPTEVLGKDIGIYAAPNTRKPLNPEQLMEGKGGKTWTRETVNARRDGTVFPVRLVSDIVRNESDVPIGLVTTCEDITERRRAEEKLALYQNQLEELARDEDYERLAGMHQQGQEVEEEEGFDACRALQQHGHHLQHRLQLLVPSLQRRLVLVGAKQMNRRKLPVVGDERENAVHLRLGLHGFGVGAEVQMQLLLGHPDIGGVLAGPAGPQLFEGVLLLDLDGEGDEVRGVGSREDGLCCPANRLHLALPGLGAVEPGGERRQLIRRPGQVPLARQRVALLLLAAVYPQNAKALRGGHGRLHASVHLVGPLLTAAVGLPKQLRPLWRVLLLPVHEPGHFPSRPWQDGDEASVVPVDVLHVVARAQLGVSHIEEVGAPCQAADMRW